VSVQEDERLRISRDLHDETGQTLTALSIVLKRLQSELPGEYPALHGWVESALELTQTASEQLHAVVCDLHPPALEVFGLKVGLEELCRAFQRHSQIPIRTQISDLPPMPELYGVTFYRCLQEALTNAARHARATQIWVGLSQVGAEWVLSVKDDGLGLPGRDAASADSARRFGLAGLKKRLQTIGGSLTIDSQTGQGTQLLIRLPEVQPFSLEQAPGA
jgi:signal transduction histidine kinase